MAILPAAAWTTKSLDDLTITLGDHSKALRFKAGRLFYFLIGGEGKSAFAGWRRGEFWVFMRAHYGAHFLWHGYLAGRAHDRV